MEVEYIIKVKDKHNPPEFKEGLGNGVLVSVTVNIENAKPEDLKDNAPLISKINNIKDEILNDYIEIDYTIND